MVRPWKLMPWALAGLSSMLLAAKLSASLAVPGSINYIEGQVSIERTPLTQKSVGSTQLDQNQVLETSQGKAEILLTPGVFLRVGDSSEVRMVSPRLTDTQIELMRGEAMVETAELFKDSNISVLDYGARIQLKKKGLYEITAGPNPSVTVYDGQVEVDRGDQHLKLSKGKQIDLNAPLRARKFDRNHHDELYAWSSLRSEYSSEASMQSAQTVVVNNGWWGPGWYWNPWWDMYAFLPGDGILYSPFGWEFYSPGFGVYPGFYGGYGYGHRFYHAGRPWAGGGASRGRSAAGGFQGRAGGFGARGFGGAQGFGAGHGMGGGHR